MNSKRDRNSREQAFTRIDLLVVLTMVFLLVIVQLPSLGNTKSGSQAAVCADNLRRLIQAWSMYADDNEGKIAPCNDGGAAGTSAGTAAWAGGWLDFSSSFDNINTGFLIDHERYPHAAYLGPYLKRDASVFKCPADRSAITAFGRLFSRVRSVSMNYWMGGNAWAGQSQFTVFRKLDDISRPEPAKALVILDEREDSINDGAFLINMTTNLVDYPAAYHDGGANLSYADGHVGFHYWSDPRTVPVLRRGENLPLNIPMVDNPDLDFLRSVATAPK